MLACSPTCILLKAIMESGQDQKKMYEEIKKVLENNKMLTVQKVAVMNNNSEKSQIVVSSGNPSSGSNQAGFKWDPSRCGQSIEITHGGFGVFLKEQAYVFRTVLADTVTVL